MVEQLLIDDDDYYVPDANQLVTEDDTSVDNFASAKQQRLLVSSIYSSAPELTFLAEANVGIYYTDTQPAIVPDVFLSLDVQVPENWWEKPNRCYLVWKFGKPPEVAIEIVSNKIGNELGNKLRIYERMRVSYYIVYDPTQQLGESVLRVYERLGLTLWEGEFEGRQDVWLRWCYRDDTVLPTGDESSQRAEQRAQQAEQRAQQLAERLRNMGIDPDTLSSDSF